MENYVMHYMFLSPAQYEESFGEEPDYNQLQLNYEDTSAGVQRQMGSDMMNQRACAGITFVTDLEQQIQDMLQALNIVIYVLILSAGLLAFVVLYNLNNINITERRREMATLKVLGFYDSEVAMYVYRENIILTIIGIGAGALMGAFLHRFIIQTVEVDLMMFGRQISFFSYLLSGLITLIFSVLVNLVMYRNLKKIDMIESLKSVEVKAAEGLQFSRFIGIIKLLTGGVHCRCKIYSKGVDVMNITISGKNIEVTDGLRAAINDKLGKLERYFTPETEVIVTLSVEKERQKIEVTIPVKGSIIRSEQVSNDMYVSIDLVEEVIERQLRKYKIRLWTSISPEEISRRRTWRTTIWKTRTFRLSDKEIRYQTHVSGRCLCADGASGT